MVRKYYRLLCCLVLLVFSMAFAQDKNPTQELVSDLLAAKIESERSQLLNQQKNLVTAELRKGLIARGDQLRIQSDFPGAMTAFDLAKQVAEQIQDKPGIAEALINIGLINRIQGDIDLALINTQKSLAIAEESGEKPLIARSLVYIGIFYRFQGDNDQALKFTNKALEYADHLSPKELALAWNNIGSAYLQQGNFSKALAYLEKGLQIREKLGDKDAIAGSLNNLRWLTIIREVLPKLSITTNAV